MSGTNALMESRSKAGVKLLKPKYIPKPYEQLDPPGQSVQIDVKTSLRLVLLVMLRWTQRRNADAATDPPSSDEFSRFR